MSRTYFSVAVVLCAWTFGAPAQTPDTATINGYVTDQSHAGVAGVQVNVKNAQSGLERKAETSCMHIGGKAMRAIDARLKPTSSHCVNPCGDIVCSWRLEWRSIFQIQIHACASREAISSQQSSSVPAIDRALRAGNVMSAWPLYLLPNVNWSESPTSNVERGSVVHPRGAGVARCRAQIIAAPDEICVGFQPSHLGNSRKFGAVKTCESWHWFPLGGYWLRPDGPSGGSFPRERNRQKWPVTRRSLIGHGRHKKHDRDHLAPTPS